MQELKDHVGKKVLVHLTEYGKGRFEKGILKEVEPFRRVGITGMSVPFVGYGTAIRKIWCGDRLLYQNEQVAPGYDARRPEEIEEIMAKSFGTEIAEKFKRERVEAERLQRKETEKLDKKARAKGPGLIEKGRAFVKKGLEAEWETYAAANTKDFYSAGVVESVVNVMNALTVGATPEKAMNAASEGITGIMAGCTASAVVHFHERGKEFNAWWNGKYGVKDTEGTVNPAVITIGIRQ